MATAKTEMREKLARVSGRPGVYLMKDAGGQILYVGKAADLKKRLASYFSRAAQADVKTAALVAKIQDFDTIITATEKEALLLEWNLIQKHRPRYNVDYKDDKRYPSLRLDMTHPYPRLQIVRKVKKDGAVYFGPFASAHAVRQTLKFINATFKLRRCKNRDFKNRPRPCLNYQMGHCLAPCFQKISPGAYQEMVQETILFLRGRTPELIRKIKGDMERAAALQEFERAAKLRDKMAALQKTLEKQVAASSDAMDRDVWGISSEVAATVATLMVVRGGFISGTCHIEMREALGTDAEIISGVIRRYYEKPVEIPREILVPQPLGDADLIAEWLFEVKNRKVRIAWPQRGPRRELVRRANENAATALQNWMDSCRSADVLLDRLQKKLGLQARPERIECFDTSNISGAEPVASQVVFLSAQPAPDHYRRYRIQTVSLPDDYRAMAETLRRRFGSADSADPLPQLLMVDGGKGQLNIACKVVQECGLQGCFDIIAIAKKEPQRGETSDKIYKPGRSNPIHFNRDADLLLLLQHIRDEAHRFAISFHRRRHRQASLASVLDSIPGIGGQRKKALLKHFGGIQRIREATLEELQSLPGMTRAAAKAVYEALAT